MGQKVSTKVVDKSQQDNAKWALMLFICKILQKQPVLYIEHDLSA